MTKSAQLKDDTGEMEQSVNQRQAGGSDSGNLKNRDTKYILD